VRGLFREGQAAGLAGIPRLLSELWHLSCGEDPLIWWHFCGSSQAAIKRPGCRPPKIRYRYWPRSKPEVGYGTVMVLKSGYESLFPQSPRGVGPTARLASFAIGVLPRLVERPALSLNPGMVLEAFPRASNIRNLPSYYLLMASAGTKVLRKCINLAFWVVSFTSRGRLHDVVRAAIDGVNKLLIEPQAIRLRSLHHADP
jgi:hypothetical protein